MIDLKAAFGGQEPFGDCEFCGKRVDAQGYCSHCAYIYEGLSNNYDFPEPLTRTTLTPRRWKDIQLIKKRGQASGKTQHEINVEVFQYAWKVTHPAQPNDSPYLSICDIPTASSYASPYRKSGRPCPVCGTDIDYDSYLCFTCGNLYSNERFYKHFPPPFTQRIFHFNNWQDIQLIKKRGKQLGKTKEEIEQAIAQYAEAAVKEMQANASNKTTAAQRIFPIASPSATTQPASSPSTATPNAASGSVSSHTQSSSAPTSHSAAKSTSPQKLTLGIRLRYIHKRIINYFKCGYCYNCGKSYWTLPAARACCAEEKKRTPPGTARRHYAMPLSPYRFSDPCPICGGSGKHNGFMCGMCDGRGSLRV